MADLTELTDDQLREVLNESMTTMTEERLQAGIAEAERRGFEVYDEDGTTVMYVDGDQPQYSWQADLMVGRYARDDTWTEADTNG